MPCADCLEQQKILIRLTAALNEREQQNQELSGKFHKYKLQTKAKFAQLRYQILENVGSEDAGNANRLSSLLLRLDETDGQLSQFKDQIDELKAQLERKDREKVDYESQIKSLQQKLNESGHKRTSNNNRKTDSTTSDENGTVKAVPANQSAEQIQQMYAQLVYKDSKILELSRHIDEQEQKIMDLQEACRERDEVNKAKTKAIQILQEQLSRHVNVKRKDQATETDISADQQIKMNQSTSSNTSPMPGRAVAFYKDQLKKDDEDSSFTTDLTANDIESSDLLRGDLLAEGKNIDKLNSRLSGLLQQVESMQKRVIKNELVEFEAPPPAANQPVLVKKKKDKKVTFDFSEQQRLAEIEDLKEKLQKSDLACNDLRDENDELRITIADLEQRLDERIAKNEYYEKLCSDLELRLENAEREVDVLNKQLDDAKKDAKTSVLKTKAQQTSKIKELEEEIFIVQTELSEKTSIILEFETETFDLKDQLAGCKEENVKLQSSLKSVEQELSTKSEQLKNLEEQLNQLTTDNELLSKTLEELKREQKNQVFKAKAHLSVRIKELEEALNNTKAEADDEIERLKLALAEFEERESELRQNYDLLDENLSLVAAERDIFLKQKEDIIRDFDQLKEIIETSQELIDFLENDLDLSYAETEELRRQLECEPEMSSKNRDSTEQRLKFKAYLAKLKSLQKDNERLDEELSLCQEKCEQLKNDKYILATDMENLRSALDMEKRKRLELEETYSDSYTVYERANVDSKNWFEKIAELQETVERKTLEISNLTDQLRQRDETLASLRQQNESLGVECENLKKQNKFLLDEKQEIENELQKLWHHDTSMKKLLSDLQSQLDSASQEKTVLYDRSRTYEEQIQQVVAKIQTLTHEKENLQTENAKLKDRLNFVESNLNVQTSSLMEQMSSLKNSLNRCNEENRLLNGENERLRVDVNDLRDDKKLLENKLHSLNVQFDEERRKYVSEKNSLEKFLEAKDGECKHLEKQLLSQQQTNNNSVSKFSSNHNDGDDVDDNAKNNSSKIVEQILNEKDSLLKLLDVEQSTRSALEQQLKQQFDIVRNLSDQLASVSEQLKLSENLCREISIEKSNYEQQLAVLIVEKAQADNAYLNLTEQLKVARTEMENLSELSTKNANFEVQLQLMQSQQGYIMQEHCNTIDNLRSLNEELQSKLALKDSKLAVLSAELSEQRSKMETLQRESEYEISTTSSPEDERSSLYEQIKSLQTTYEALKHEKQKLSDERQTLCNEIINLNSLLSESQNQIEAQKIVVDGMSHSIDEVIKENENLKEQLTLVQTTTTTDPSSQQLVSKESYQQLSASYNQLHDAHLCVIAQLNEKEQNVEQLQFNFADVERRLNDSVRLNEVLAEEKTKVVNTLHQLEEKLALFQSNKPEVDTYTQAANGSFLPTEFDKGQSIQQNTELISGDHFVPDDNNNIEIIQARCVQLENEKQQLESKIRDLELEKSELETFIESNSDELEWKVQVLESEKRSILETSAVNQQTIEALRLELSRKAEEFAEERNRLLQQLTAETDAAETVDKFKNEIELLEGKVHQLQNERNGFTSSLHDLNENENQFNRSSTTNAIEQLESLNFEKELLEKTLKSMEVEKEKREHEIVLLRSEVSGLNQHISTLVNEVDNYRMKLRKSEERTTANDAHFGKLDREFQETLVTEALLKEEIVALKRLCQNFDAEKLEISNRLNSELESKNVLIEKLTIVEKELQQKDEKISALENVLKQIGENRGEESAQLVQQVENFKQLYKETLDEKNRLHEKLRNLFSENDALLTERETLKETVTNLEEKLSSFNILNDVENENKQLADSVEKLKQSLQSLEENLRESNENAKTWENKYLDAKTTVDVLNEQIKCYANQVEASENEADAVRIECLALQEKLNDLEEVFSNASMSNEELSAFWSNKCREVEQELASTKTRLNDVEAERNRLVNEIDTMKQELLTTADISEKSVKMRDENFEEMKVSFETEKLSLIQQLEAEQKLKSDLQTDYNNVLSSKQAVDEQLKHITTDLENQKLFSKNELNSMEQLLTTYKNQLEDTKKLNVELEEQQQQMSEQNNDSLKVQVLERQLFEANAKLDLMQNSKNSLLTEIEKLKVEVEEKEKNFAEFCIWKEAAEAKNIEIVKEYENLQTTYAQLYDAYCTVSSEKSSFSEQQKNLHDSQMSELREKLATLETEHAQCSGRIEELLQENSRQLAIKVEDLETTHELESKSLANNLQAVQAEFQTLKKDFDDLLLKYTEESSRNTSQKQLLSEMQTKNEDLLQELEIIQLDSTASKTSSAQTIAELKSQLQLANETNEMLELACDDLEKVKSENKHLSEIKKCLENEIENLKTLQQQQQQQRSTTNELQKNQELEHESLVKTGDDNDEELLKSTIQKTYEERMKEMEKKFQQQIDALEWKLEESVSSETDLRDEIDDYRKQLNSAEEKIRELESSIQMQERISQSDLQNEKFVEQITILKQENEQLTKGTSEIASEFENVKQEYRRKLAVLDSTIDELKAENQRMSTVLYDSEASCTRFKQKIQELNVELAELKVDSEKNQQSSDELSALKRYVQSLEKEKDYLLTQLNENKTSFGQLQTERQMLRNEIETLKNEQLLNSKLTNDLKKASQDAQHMVANLEHERSSHSQVQREIGELKEQLSHTERQLESCRLKLAERDVLKEKLKEIEIQMDRLLTEKRDSVNKEKKFREEMSKLTENLVSEQNDKIMLGRKLEESKQEYLKLQDKCRLLEVQLDDRLSLLNNNDNDNDNDNNTPPTAAFVQEKLSRQPAAAATTTGKTKIQKMQTGAKAHSEEPNQNRQQQQVAAEKKPKASTPVESQTRQRRSPSSQVVVESDDVEGGGGDLAEDDTDAHVGSSLLSQQQQHQQQLRSNTEIIIGTPASISLAVNPSVLNRFNVWLKRRARLYLYQGSFRRLSLFKIMMFLYLLIIHLFILECWLR